MPSFIDVVNGANADATTIQQVIDALKGTAGKGIPLSPTAVNDAINFGLSVKNNDAGASKAAIFYKADGTVLLQIDKNGVVASADGVAAAAKVVTAGDAGTVTNAMLAGSIANAKLAADVARANLLVNGGHEIWQRGAGPFTAVGAYAADRWVLGQAGTDTLSVSKDTTNADTTNGSVACSACTFVLGTGAGLSTYAGNGHAIADGLQIANRQLSFSMRVKTATANAVRVGIYNGAAWTYSAFHSGGGAYETLTVAGVAMPASGASVAQVAAFFAASCTAYLDNAMLVIGAIAADYVPLPPADDLARCLRYYELLTVANSTVFLVQGNATAAQTWSFAFPFRALKAATPTFTKVGTWTVANAGQPTVNGDTAGLLLQVAAAAAGIFSAQNTGATTTVTAEANP